jgi:predicted secreted protein
MCLLVLPLCSSSAYATPRPPFALAEPASQDAQRLRAVRGVGGHVANIIRTLCNREEHERLAMVKVEQVDEARKGYLPTNAMHTAKVVAVPVAKPSKTVLRALAAYLAENLQVLHFHQSVGWCL